MLNPRLYAFLVRKALPSLLFWDVIAILMFVFDAQSMAGWDIILLYILYAAFCILLPYVISCFWQYLHKGKGFHLKIMTTNFYVFWVKALYAGRILLAVGLLLFNYSMKITILLPVVLLFSLWLSCGIVKWWKINYFKWFVFQENSLSLPLEILFTINWMLMMALPGLLVFLLILAMDVMAIRNVLQSNFSNETRVLLIILILLFPFLGPIVYYLIRPMLLKSTWKIKVK